MTETRTIAFVLYPGLTALDFVGPLQVISALKEFGLGFEAVTVAAAREPLQTDTSLSVTASHTFEQVPAPYGLIVPGGGVPTFTALADEQLTDYVRQAARSAEVVASVCTGSLILGSAGLLEGREATTHWAAMPILRAFGATPVSRRWVVDGRVLTAAGVAAGIDMALHLAGELVGEDAARMIQATIEYDPQPPFGPIDWDRVDRGFMESWIRSAAEKGLADHPELLARLAMADGAQSMSP
ncbi:DJ-1/PfpI family protein [Streptomyces sp. NBRC 110028]|uniref:DJ-1/PfpI family protein n=1 Tax=Streptomyces sp. NBRC 110028 TaxID=1621260 RepID=UPI0006E4433A|nr:DJ-1/PfpI family protein [Streptomyces sp. NBRC 110028]